MQMQETSKLQTIDITDGMLARQTLAGDQYAFEHLVKRYSTPLFNFIYRFLGDYDQACDILQHVFIQLHTSLPTLRTDKPLKAWLFQVARNRCPEELAEQSDLQQHLHNAIQTLPIKFRSVVLLRYAAQLSFSEIGQALNMPEATAKTYFQRSKPLLRAAL